jgi:hypothetical protein
MPPARADHVSVVVQMPGYPSVTLGSEPGTWLERSALPAGLEAVLQLPDVRMEPGAAVFWFPLL